MTNRGVLIIAAFYFYFSAFAAQPQTEREMQPPSISIAPLLTNSSERSRVIYEIYHASQEWGFFHIIDHGIDIELQGQIREEMISFFTSPDSIKRQIQRNEKNSRGFAESEFTKQIVDAKQVLDIGHKPYSDLPDNDPLNFVLDGFNQYPNPSLFPRFRRVVDNWYGNCTKLGELLVGALAEALSETYHTHVNFSDAFSSHTSFLRLNYYPITHFHADASGATEVLGVNRHTDAGMLTILLQDSNADGLEVYSGSRQENADGSWVPVRAVEGALTINTGDMLQVYSNNDLRAPEHRVKKSTAKERFSAPFFYNPNYDTLVAPLLHEISLYRPINWGEFRSNRFKCDYSDHGRESQIEDYLINRNSNKEL